jgi:20S proteasome subunit alpha 1
VGIRGKNCVAVCIEKKVDDRMIDPSTVSNIFRVTPEVGVMMTGREADGRAWITKLKKEAYDFLNENGF